MTEKLKRKYDSKTLFHLKIMLLVCIIWTVITSFFPMIWLAPPLFALTPFVYIALSLLWIPIVWRSRRLIVWDRIVKVLIVACILSNIIMISDFTSIILSPTYCTMNNPYFEGELICSTESYYSPNWGTCKNYLAPVKQGHLLIMGNSPMFGPLSCPLGLF